MHSPKIKIKNKYELDPEDYQQSPHKQQYLYQKLIMTAAQLKISFDAINLSELQTLFNVMKIYLTDRMFHQVLIYSSKAIAKGSLLKKKTTNRSIRVQTQHAPKYAKKDPISSLPSSIVNNQKICIDPTRAAIWLYTKYSNEQISFYSQPSEFSQPYKPRIAEKSKILGSCISDKIRMKTRFQEDNPEFPSVYCNKPEIRFKSGVKQIKNAFDEMRKERQENGIVPLDFSSDEEPHERMPFNAVDFDPTLHEVNKKLKGIKQKAERSLTDLVEATAYDEKLKLQLQQILMKHCEQRPYDLQKIGRYGAMKAHRRLNERRKKQLQKIEKIRAQLNLTGI